MQMIIKKFTIIYNGYLPVCLLVMYVHMCCSITDPEVLFNRSVELGSIVVDWVDNEFYWVERQLGYRVCR